VPDATRLERLLGTVLRVGILTAGCVLVLSGGWYLFKHGTEPVPARETFTPDLESAGPWAILQRAARLESRGWIALGLLLVLGTPLARVFVSVCAFARRRDWIFLGLTLAVLAVLLSSLFLGV
jgi:uncharacterized membrane protein